MKRRLTRSTRTDTLCPYTTLVRSAITVHLALHLCKLGAIALDKELLALFAGPALVVQAGVDHHSACAERKALQIAEPPDLEFIIGAQFVSQLFAIERPAFAESVEGQDQIGRAQV